MERYEEAIESFDKAIALKVDDAGAYYDKACCYGLWGRVEEAIDTLRRAIELDPENREMAKTDTDFDRIRQDERFQNLLR